MLKKKIPWNVFPVHSTDPAIPKWSVNRKGLKREKVWIQRDWCFKWERLLKTELANFAICPQCCYSNREERQNSQRSVHLLFIELRLGWKSNKNPSRKLCQILFCKVNCTDNNYVAKNLRIVATGASVYKEPSSFDLNVTVAIYHHYSLTLINLLFLCRMKSFFRVFAWVRDERCLLKLGSDVLPCYRNDPERMN